MTLVLNGTTGVSAVDGSAATPAIQGNDSNTGIFFPAADTIAFAEGGAEVARFDSSGNLGIGTSSPQAKLHAVSTVTITNDATYPIIAGDATTNGKRLLLGYTGASNGYGVIQAVSSGVAWTDLVAQPNGGNLLVGTTSTTPNPGFAIYPFGGFSAGNSAGSNGFEFATFRRSATQIGSITQNGTTGVTYGTSSDYRLKENVQPMTGALEKIALLKPCTYKWKTDGSDGQGFIAHELQAVVPDAVVGAKDAVDADGNIVPQGIDTSFLVATLTAAIQEQQALIAALQADVAALKGQA